MQAGAGPGAVPSPADFRPPPNPLSAGLRAANKIIDKSADYKDSLLKIFKTSQAFNMTFSSKGLKGVKELESVIATARSDAKNIAKRTCESDCNITTKINALKDVSDHLQGRITETDEEERNRMANRAAGKEGEETPVSHVIDFNALFQEKLAQQEKPMIYTRHDWFKQTLKMLGEENTKKRKKGDDSDSDLEVVEDENNAEAELKCPIVGTLFEEPMKSKKCQHVFSKAGLDQWFRRGVRQCAVPGCRQKKLEKKDFEPDREMELKIERFMKREEKRKRRERQRAAEDSEDDLDCE